MPEKWMQSTRNPKTEGSFSRAAKRAGMSTQAFAERKQHAPGKLGRRARLALVYAKYRPHKRQESRTQGRTQERGQGRTQERKQERSSGKR